MTYKKLAKKILEMTPEEQDGEVKLRDYANQETIPADDLISGQIGFNLEASGLD